MMHDYAVTVIGLVILSALALLAALGVTAIMFMAKLRKLGKIETKKGAYTWTAKEVKTE